MQVVVAQEQVLVVQVQVQVVQLQVQVVVVQVQVAVVAVQVQVVAQVVVQVVVIVWPINSGVKKEIYESDYSIFHTLFLIITLLFVIAIICYSYIKNRSRKNVLPH